MKIHPSNLGVGGWPKQVRNVTWTPCAKCKSDYCLHLLRKEQVSLQTIVCGGCSVQESQGAEIQSQVGHQQRKVARLCHATWKHGSTRTVPTKILDPECFSGRTETQSWGAQSWSVGWERVQKPTDWYENFHSRELSQICCLWGSNSVL